MEESVILCIFINYVVKILILKLNLKMDGNNKKRKPRKKAVRRKKASKQQSITQLLSLLPQKS